MCTLSQIWVVGSGAKMVCVTDLGYLRQVVVPSNVSTNCTVMETFSHSMRYVEVRKLLKDLMMCKMFYLVVCAICLPS